MTKSLLHSLSQAQLQVIAKRHLAGETSAEIADAMHLHPWEVKNLFNTIAMKDILASESSFHDRVVARAKYRMGIDLEDAVDRMKLRGRGQDGPQIAFQADKFVIEQIMPRRAEPPTETHIHHSIDIQVLAETKEILKEIQTVRASRGNGQGESFDRYVLTGTEGIETLEPSDATQVLGVAGPVGSGTTGPEPDGRPEPDDTG